MFLFSVQHGRLCRTLTYLFILSPVEPLERACAQSALHPFGTSYRCKMLPCSPLLKQEKLNKHIRSNIHSNSKAGRQTHAGLEVVGEILAHSSSPSQALSCCLQQCMLGESSGKTGIKKRKTSRAYILRMGNNIYSWQSLPSPQPALEREQTEIHVPPSPPTPQLSHQ